MNILLTSLVNLNDRVYINGMALVESLLDELRSHYHMITNFELRLHKPLYKIPELTIDVMPRRSEDAVGSGSFITIGGVQLYYELRASDIECVNRFFVDETAIEARIEKREDQYRIEGLTVFDNPHVCWNAIGRQMNLNLMTDLDLRGSGKQMWFTGLHLNSIAFTYTKPKSIAVSTAFDRLSAKCIKRDIYFNDKLVGSRTSVYA